MKIKDILTEIEFPCEWLIKMDENVDVASMSVISGTSLFQSSTVYIGTLSDLPDKLPENTNFICCLKTNAEPTSTAGKITEPDGSSLASRQPCCNLILAHAAPSSLLHAVSLCFEQSLRLASAMEALIKDVTGQKGLNRLLETAYQLTGIPMFVRDQNFRLLAYNQAICRVHEDFREAVLTGKFKDSRRANANRLDIREGPQLYEDMYFTWGETDQRYYLIGHIYINALESAEFAALTEPGEPLRHYSLICLIRQLVTVELQKVSLAGWNESLIENSFFKQLLENTLDPEQISKTAARLNWVSAKTMQLLVIDASNGYLTKDSIAAVKHEIRNLFPGCRTTMYESHYIVLTSTKKRDKEQAEGNSHQISVHKFHQLLKDHRLIAGLSADFHDLADMQTAYTQACRTLDYIIHRNLPGPAAAFSQCMYLVMYDALAETCSPKQFYHPGILKFYQDECREHKNWFHTLEVYLEHYGNTSQAAKLLNIHSNTLLYRIHRISEMYGLNFSDNEERMHMLLTIRLMDREKTPP